MPTLDPIRTLSLTVISAAFLCLGIAKTAQAFSFTEVGDAQETLNAAQNVTGPLATPLETIAGLLRKDADLFRIYLSGEVAFSATTVGTSGTLQDTQLFLFDATGKGIYGNDDAVNNFAGRSTLPTRNLAAGIYYLAISSFNYDPYSNGGLIFDNNWSGVQNPIGPGGDQPLTDWDGPSYYEGSYTIKLTGAEAVPEPISVLGFMLGAGLLGKMRHHRNSPGFNNR